MRNLKPSVKAAIASTLVITSTAAIAYAVPKLTSEKNSNTENQLKLDVERVDSDTVKVAIDNVQDIPKAIQFSIKLEGASLKNGESSIKDLIKDEVQKRLDNNEYLTSSNDVLTDYTYNESNNTIDVLITAENSLPKTENRIDIFELDVKGESADTKTYKVLPNKADEYKYVSNTNKEYGGLSVTHDNKEIDIISAPTISSDERYISIVEGETLDLTLDKLEEKIGLKLNHEEGNENLTLEVKKGNKTITEFSENTPGIYELELIAVKNSDIKSEPLKIQVNVGLDKITEPPTIIMNGEELKDITIDGGSIFKPLEGVSASDKKGRDVKVEVKVDKALDLDPEQDTDYTLTYTATDIYGNKATKEVTLKVIANKAPVISGVEDRIISVGDKFDPTEGVTVTDEDNDIELKVDSNINTNIAGEYKVSYSATDSKGKTTRVQSKVTVNPKPATINKAPAITAEDKVIGVGDKFDPLAGVSAKDAEDGDVTSKIEVVENTVDTTKVGTYKVKYSVTDSKGATVTKEITVTVNPKPATINKAPVITAEDKVINVGDKFDPLTAVSAKDAEDGDVTSKITVVENTVDTTKVGTYKVKYSVTDSKGATVTREITVTVKKVQKPVIEITSNQTITVGDNFNPLEGVKAYDKDGVDITSNIKVEGTVDTSKAGDYKLTYKVQDSEAIEASLTVIITVKEKTDVPQQPVVGNNGPVIKLTSLTNTITVGSEFDPLNGVSAYDEEDGDLTSSIKISGSVDTSKAGEYKLVYTVQDKDGNISTLTRVIIVENVDKPTIENNNNSTVENEDKPTTENNSNPTTGDNSILGYLGIFAVSLGGLFFARKKQK